ncbi:MAG: hypothetical protein EA362_04425 [Saprospirales bacterium]|nr:MAG: hypothetical protein EA362_04425 [Saprospirales bacterium]
MPNNSGLEDNFVTHDFGGGYVVMLFSSPIDLKGNLRPYRFRFSAWLSEFLKNKLNFYHPNPKSFKGSKLMSLLK